MDALHVNSAVEIKCTHFLTKDGELRKRIEEIKEIGLVPPSLRPVTLNGFLKELSKKEKGWRWEGDGDVEEDITKKEKLLRTQIEAERFKHELEQNRLKSLYDLLPVLITVISLYFAINV